MYVFVRKDLSRAQQVVQACHAAMEMVWRQQPEIPTECPAAIVLGVENEDKLKSLLPYLDNKAIGYACFYEQDLGGELTAVCTIPLDESQKRLFRSFKLLQ